MKAAIGAASLLVGKVVKQLSDGVVEAYVASAELGLSMEQIKIGLMYTQGLLCKAQGRRDVTNNPGLSGLLEILTNKADEAEDLLDELHYFIIQDQIDGTHEATPMVGDGLCGQVVLHGCHALRHTAGNWFSCFSCSCTRDDAGDVPDHVDKLTFNRVDMSKKIKSVIEGIHAACNPVSNLLPRMHSAVSLKRPPTSSTITQNKLYGRKRNHIFNQTLDDMCTIRSETLSVLPIVGLGGLGKTNFTQHLYNHKRTEEHFSANKAWVCVSTNFDVVRLTQEILRCICQNRNDESSTAHETSNLDQLQKSISEKLDSKRFLLVLDDMWKCNSEAEWERLLAPFKKGEAKGSMVIVTTRKPSIAKMVTTAKPIELEGLEDDEFFKFFEECIFDQDKPKFYKDDLIDVARKISEKLYGNPLLAKSVGRLLKNNLSQESWMEVLERNEWKNLQGNDDIIPALRISYDYLPFELKKCFSYCALYPKDYRFDNLEITYFWEALGILDYEGQNIKDDDVGLKYLDELVGNGFLMKVGDDSRPYYVMHDPLHDLAQNISSQECINISSYNFRSDSIPQSIRHVSITLQDKYEQSFEREIEKFKTKTDIGNLRTLMLFGKGNASMTFFKDLLKETKCLRVLFMHADSLESFPQNFSKLIHLRYLKLEIPYDVELSLPNSISRFHHLKFLDLRNSRCILPKDMNRLVNLCLFLATKELCSNIPGIGKMKYLQRLEEYHVKKEDIGFELSELGDLTELGGELKIFNLENVATREEANQAKLWLKRNLRTLMLTWGAVQQTTGSDVLDGLQPHSNLRALGIRNHGGPTGPGWLCTDIRINGLKCLHLEGISWGTLPPFGQLMHLEELTLINIAGMHQFGPDFGGVTQRSFLHLKKIEFVGMPELVEWVGGAHCHLFSKLSSIRCKDCPNLSMLLLPSSVCSVSCTQDITNTTWFPNLRSLQIENCPRLSLPPLPHTSMLNWVTVKEDNKLLYLNGERLTLNSYGSALAFHNLNKVEFMAVVDMPFVSLTDLQKLNSLRSLVVRQCESMLFSEVDEGVIFHSVHQLNLGDFHITRKSLTKLSNYFPALTEFRVNVSLEVEEEEETVLRVPWSSLSYFQISGYVNLVLPVEDGGGLQYLSSLQALKIRSCGKMFARWSTLEAGALSSKPFPASLRLLEISEERSMQSMGLLSNLTSLTHLVLVDCDNLTVDGFDPIITHNLKILVVYNNHRCSVAADLFSLVARMKVIPAACSFFQQLKKLSVDSISAVLVVPISSLLAATLCDLTFNYDSKMESFTKEQEEALQLLTSLRYLRFSDCIRLRSLPEGLRRLSSLERLGIFNCSLIRSLPEEGLPASLKMLGMEGCSTDLVDQAKKFKASRPDLYTCDSLMDYDSWTCNIQ